ncbi:MAG: aldo/keto reductase [Rikenellaceae bacterium]
MTKIDRRDFIKIVGGTAATITLASCASGSKKDQPKGDVPKGKMEYRTGPKGEKISLLGYGCMRFPRLKNPVKGENVCDQEAVNELVDYALEHGINYFDTAPGYIQGWSERTTGAALSRHPRESYYLATKMSNQNPKAWSYEESVKIYKRSLESLRTDYIDFMLLHSIGDAEREQRRFFDNGILNFLMEEREAGRIRNLGFSFHGDQEVFDNFLSMHDEVHWDFVMIQCNYLDWRYANQINKKNVNAEYLYSELHRRNIPVIIMEPLLGGRLASVPEYIAQKFKSFEPNKSIASWAFRYSGSLPDVITILSGMTYLEDLQDNIRTFSPLVPINDKEAEMLDESAKLIMEYNAIPCNDCKYCMPCPYGVDIPAILLHYNKCIFEDKIIEDSSDPEYIRARREFLIGYDRSAPKLRQAQHCTGCGVCSPKCPQRIDIVEELHKIDAYAKRLREEGNGL